jgi:TRAP-type transport system periplasmic protein
MKRMILASVGAAVLALASLTAEAQTLRFGHANGEGEIAAALFTEFAERVGERTNGELTVRVFPNEQLGKEVELVQQVKAGALDISAPSMAAASTLVPSLEMPSAPFLWDNWEEAQAVILSDGMEPAFDELAEQHDILPLSKVWYWGWRNLTTLDTPVRTPADLQGLKIRVPESPVWVEMVRAFGAAPTPVPFSEVYSALQQKVVDGQENPIPTIFTRRFYEVQGYVVMTRHMLQNNMMVINKSRFEGLEPAHQLVLIQEAQRVSALNTAIQQRLESEMLEAIREAGNTEVIEDPDREAFAALMDEVYPRMADRWGQENFARLQEAITELRQR